MLASGPVVRNETSMTQWESRALSELAQTTKAILALAGARPYLRVGRWAVESRCGTVQHCCF